MGRRPDFMQLKSQVEWALHCCTVLAALPRGQYLSTKALAEFHGVPKEYLSKALQSVSNAGLVTSTLGPSGGYRLARSAEKITVLDVVQAVEGDGLTFVCNEIRQNNPCRPDGYCDKRSCPIARVMWQAHKAWRDVLRGVTLANLGETIETEVPGDLLQASFAWLTRGK